MRRLAAEMRAHAAETDIAIYRRKFEGLASELDEAVTVAEHSDGFHA